MCVERKARGNAVIWYRDSLREEVAGTEPTMSAIAVLSVMCVGLPNC